MNVEGSFDALAIDAVARPSLTRWLELLVEWNQRIDLTAARTDDEITDRMLADAAFLARHLSPSARVIDVGSGAGGPRRPDGRSSLASHRP